MFDAPLPTNIQANDPDLPGILNTISGRLNTTRAEADLIPRRNIKSLLDPAVWDVDSASTIAEVVKLGPILVYRFQLKASATPGAASASKMILPTLPLPYRPVVTGALGTLMGISGVVSGPALLVVETQPSYIRARSMSTDMASFTIDAGAVYSGMVVGSTYHVGTAADIPGTAV